MPSSETENIKRYDNIYSLFVNDIPEELNEDGIKTLFNDFGTITALLFPSGGKFAYVSYAFYSEAKAAIEGLHEKPPLDLQVQFRRKKDENNDFISRTANVECKIVAVEKVKQLYRVQKVDDTEQYNEFHENLNKAGATLETIKTPLVGKIYAVPYGGRWYRGKVISLDPLMIDYIDQGIITELKNPNFKCLSIEFANVANFSRFVKLSETSSDGKMKNLWTGCHVKLRMIGYDCENDVIHVVSEEEEEKQAVKIVKEVVKSTSRPVQSPQLVKTLDDDGEKKVQVGLEVIEIVEEKSKTVESEPEVVEGSKVEEKKLEIVKENVEVVEKKIESEDEKIENEEKKIESDGKKIENEEKKIENEEKKIKNNEKKIENEEKKIENEEKKIENEEKKIESEEKKIESEEKKIESEKKKKENEEKKIENEEKNSDNVENNLEEKQSSPASVFEIGPSVLDNLKPAMTNVPIKIANKLSPTTATAIMDYATVGEPFPMHTLLKKQCDSLASSHKDYKPKLYDYICFKRTEDTDWYRGVVLSTEKPFKIASLDEGTQVMVEKIIPVPTPFKNIGSFAAFQLKTNDEFPLNLGDTSELRVCDSEPEPTENIRGIVYAEFIDLATKVEVTQWKPWINNNSHPAINSSKINIKNPDFKNDSKVYIQSYLGPSVVCLKSLEPEEIENRNRLNQEISSSLSSLDYLINPPAIDDYVLGKYSNGNFYRAKVLKNDDVNKIVVEFIDYGIIETIQMKKLRNITESLMGHPLGIVQVSLKGVTNDPPTKSALDYIRILIVKEETLTCNFKETLQDGVILKTENNKVVNDKINDLLTPSWRKGKGERVIIDVQKSRVTMLQLNGVKSERVDEEKNEINECFDKSKSPEPLAMLQISGESTGVSEESVEESTGVSEESVEVSTGISQEPVEVSKKSTGISEESTGASSELPGATEAPKKSSRKRKLPSDSSKKTKTSSRSKKPTATSPPPSKRSKDSSPKSKRSRDDSPKSKASTESRSVFDRLAATKDKPDKNKSTPPPLVPWCTYCKRSTHDTANCYSKPSAGKNKKKRVSPIRYKTANDEPTSTKQQAPSSSLGKFCGYCFNDNKNQRYYKSHNRSECRFQKEDILRREAQKNCRTREHYSPSEWFLRTYDNNNSNGYRQVGQEINQEPVKFYEDNYQLFYQTQMICPNSICPSYDPRYRRSEHGPLRCGDARCPFQ